MSDDNYNPRIQEVEHYRYTPYFQLNTELIPQQLEITLVTHLNKKTIPGAYSLKTFTRRQLPNDYMVAGDVILYLKNLTNKNINIEFYSINIEQKHLPLSSRRLSIPVNGYDSVRLGQVTLDSRLTSLFTSIEYNADEHLEKVFDMRRISKDAAVKHEDNKNNAVNDGTTIEFKENNPIEIYFRREILE